MSMRGLNSIGDIPPSYSDQYWYHVLGQIEEILIFAVQREKRPSTNSSNICLQVHDVNGESDHFGRNSQAHGPCNMWPHFFSRCIMIDITPSYLEMHGIYWPISIPLWRLYLVQFVMENVSYCFVNKIKEDSKMQCNTMAHKTKYLL